MTDPMDCARFREQIGVVVDDALDSADAAAFESHRSSCTPCGRRFDAARDADTRIRALFACYTAPSPSQGFAERVVERLLSEPLEDADELWRADPAPSPPPGFADRVIAALRGGGSRAFGRVRLVTAAAVLLAIGALGLREAHGPGARRSVDVATEWISVDELIRRYGDGARIEYVVHRQFPDGIGTFDSAPAFADLSRRATGNEFHRALRESLSGESR